MKFQFLPEAASSTAGQVDALFWFLVLVTIFFLTVIFVPMGWFLYKYRRGNPADRTPLRISTWKIEVFWTSVPMFLTFVIFGWGAGLFVHLRTPPEDAQEINVVGKQWMWRLQHPEGKREINALHVPVGRTVKLVMTSEDVIHCFSIPAFRIKQDVLPGRYTQQWFKATKAGTYHLFCSEFCGNQHSHMIGAITVMNPEEYQNWLNSGSTQETQIAAGERLFHQLGCSGCHAENSKVRAPSLVGLYGKPVPITGGGFVTADERYLHDSIVMPAKQIVQGYENLMPSFEGQLNEEQLFQLVQYLKYLGREQPPEYRRQGEGAAQFTVPQQP